MIRQEHAAPREEIVARAIAPVAAELRLIDAGDLVAYVRLEQHAALSDLVASAAELYLMPGTLELGAGSEARADWDGAPSVRLALELRLGGVTVYFTLALEGERAGVEVSFVSFRDPDPDENRNTAALACALAEACIRGRPGAAVTLLSANLGTFLS